SRHRRPVRREPAGRRRARVPGGRAAARDPGHPGEQRRDRPRGQRGADVGGGLGSALRRERERRLQLYEGRGARHERARRRDPQHRLGGVDGRHSGPVRLLHDQGGGADHDVLGRPRLCRAGDPLQRDCPGTGPHPLRRRLPGEELSGAGAGDVRRAVADEAFFGSGGLERLARWLAEDGAAAPVVPYDARLGPPIGRPSKIVCVGLNYRDHARESGMAIPDEPVLFFKATTAITGPNDDVIIPKNASKVDWEVELAVVIGRRAAYVERAKALEHVAGYVLHNDYSERAFQLERGGQW